MNVFQSPARNANNTAASKLLAAGLPIFPCDELKWPKTAHWRQDSTSDRDAAREMWHTAEGGIAAIDLGKAGLIVIDCDRHGGPDGVTAFHELVERNGGLPEGVPMVETANGGLHLFFAQPANGEPLGNARGALPAGIDVRGAGGYVIAPGARLADGRCWRGKDGAPDLSAAFANRAIPSLPAWLAKIIKPPREEAHEPPRRERAAGNRSPYALAALEGECDAIARAVPGSRNETLNRAAFFLGQLVGVGELDEAEVSDRLHAAARACGLPASEARATIRSGLGEGKTEPRQRPDDGFQRARYRFEDPAPPAPIFRRIINPASWEGVPVPDREWIVPDYIPHKTVTLLYGDGSAGKSLLTLQLGAARALARDWIGLMPTHGRTLILSAEDDADEMQRRLDDIRKHYGTRMLDFAEMRLIDLVGEDCILGALMKGQIHPTPMYQALDALMSDFKPSLVCLDVLADMFAGDENDRPQARQFIGLLKKLARKHDCAFLLLAHPSLTGMSTGTGMSGNTGWSNSVRARLYFQTVKAPDGGVVNRNWRSLEGKKSNYGAPAEPMTVEWKRGVFVPVAEAGGFDKLAADAKADDLFLSLLTRFAEQDRNVSANTGPSYAPTRFAEEPDAKGFTKRQLVHAMSRLLRDGKIRVETFGPPSKKRSKLALAGPVDAVSNDIPTAPENPSNGLPTRSNGVCVPTPLYPPEALEGASALEDADAYQAPKGTGERSSRLAGNDIVAGEL